MADVKKYQIGDTFKSTRFDEAFVISGMMGAGTKNKTVKGRSVAYEVFSYEMSRIPEQLVDILPSGVKWKREHKPFPSHDELIDREIALGNWKKVE